MGEGVQIFHYHRFFTLAGYTAPMPLHNRQDNMEHGVEEVTNQVRTNQ